MTEHVTAGILVIGDEILSGRTQEKNVHFLASQFTQMGILLKEVAIIPDNAERIKLKVREFAKQFDYVVTTGGIGPTHDDITVESVAKALRLPLVLNPKVVAKMKAHYKDQLNDARLKMAHMPAGAKIIESSVSAIPSFMALNVLVLAGIPTIMQSMFLNAKRHFRTGLRSHNIVIPTHLKEGQFSAALAVLQGELPHVTIGSYPIYGEDRKNHVDLVLSGYQPDLLEEAAVKVKKLLASLESAN